MPGQTTFVTSLVLAAACSLAWADDPSPAHDYRVTRVRVYPRLGQAAEMAGGRIVGSLSSATNDFEDIAEINRAPAEGAWTEFVVPKDRVRAYRFLKYQARNDVYGDVAELEFYAGDRKLAGKPFGTVGAGEETGGPKLAFDGDTATFFRGGGVFPGAHGLLTHRNTHRMSG
jgi:hypothetical protein